MIYDFTELLWVIFFLLNAVISDIFGKKLYFLHDHLICNMMMLMALVPSKIFFYENELCIIQKKDKSKVMILCF